MSEKIKSIIEFVATGINGVNSQINGIKNPASSAMNSIEGLNKSIKKLTQLSGISATTQAFQATRTAITDTVNAFKGVYDIVFGKANEFSEHADTIAKSSRLIGLSAKDYQGMQYAASLSGMEVESLDSALKKFTVNTGQALSGNKNLSSAFEALGVKIKNTDGSIRSNKDILLDTAGAYTKLKSVQDKNLISQTLFGKSGLQMSELFKDGSVGLKSMLDEYNSFGGGISEKDLTNGEEFNDELFRMNTALGAIKISIMSEMMPAFINLFKTVTNYIKTHREQINEVVSKIAKRLPDMINTLSQKIPEIFDKMQSIFKTIDKIVDLIGPWKTVFIGVGLVIGTVVLTAITAVATAITTIAPLITGLIIPAIGGIITAILPMLPVIGMVAIGIIAWKEVITSVMDNWDMLKSFVVDDCLGGIIKAVNPFIQKISSGFSWIGNKISMVFSGVKNTVLDVLRAIFDKYLFMAEKITSTLSNLPGVGSAFKDINVGIHGMMDSDFMHPERNENTDVMRQISETYSEIKSNSTTTQRFAVDFSGMPRGVTVKPPEKGGDFDYSAGYLFGGGL